MCCGSVLTCNEYLSPLNKISTGLQKIQRLEEGKSNRGDFCFSAAEISSCIFYQAPGRTARQSFTHGRTSGLTLIKSSISSTINGAVLDSGWMNGKQSLRPETHRKTVENQPDFSSVVDLMFDATRITCTRVHADDGVSTQQISSSIFF